MFAANVNLPIAVAKPLSLFSGMLY